MAGKFNLNQLLTDVSKKAASGKEGHKSSSTMSSKIKVISVYDLIPSEDNFYSMNAIEELKGKIELAGKILQNLVVLPLGDGKYKVVSGHRRRAASIALVEEGKVQYEFVPCMVEENEADAEVQAIREEIMLIAANSQREKTAWDKLEEVRRTRALMERAKKQSKLPGGLRDLVAKVLHTSPTQIGRYDAIARNLSSDFMEELKQERINISTAYELSGLTEQEQATAFNRFKDSGTISIKDAKAKKTEPVQLKRKQEGSPDPVTRGREATSTVSVQNQIEKTGCTSETMLCRAIDLITLMIDNAKEGQMMTVTADDIKSLEIVLHILKQKQDEKTE
ncbi:ParB/RepB/Spo0J family partition protein [Fusibacter sp. JL298sf-3]